MSKFDHGRVNKRASDLRDRKIGQRIRALRLERGISQTELGNLIGVTFQQIQKYEKGANRVAAGRLHRIAETLRVPITFFYAEPENDEMEIDSVEAGLQFLDSELAVRLGRAFSRIQDVKVKQLFVELIEKLAG
jgi:transcriptional regulator with XRE-family HTH domain